MTRTKEHPAVKILEKAFAKSAGCCAGTHVVDAKDLTLFFCGSDGPGVIDFADTKTKDFRGLLSACKVSNVAYTSSKGVLHVLPPKFATTFQLSQSKIMDIVCNQLLVGDQCDGKVIKPELTQLVVQGKQSFFKSKHTKSYATLYIILPTCHTGGRFKFTNSRENGDFFFDAASKLSNPSADSPKMPPGLSVAYIACTNKVETEFTPITAGHRIALVYGLVLETDGNAATRPPDPTNYIQKAHANYPVPPSKELPPTTTLTTPLAVILKSKLQEVLGDSSFLPDGGLMAFTLQSFYPFLQSFQIGTPAFCEEHNPLNITLTRLLRGADDTLRTVCQSFGLDPKLCVVHEPYGGGEVRYRLRGIVGSEHLASGPLCDYEMMTILESCGSRCMVHESCGAEAVEWVYARPKKREVVNRLCVPYVDEDAELGWLVQDVCMIVQIGEFGSRTTMKRRLWSEG